MFCKNCGQKISPKAKVCPNCGFRDKDGTVKNNSEVNDNLLTLEECKKLTAYQIVFYAFSALICVFMLFIPVFSWSVLDAYGTGVDSALGAIGWSELLSGTVKVSYFEELKTTIKVITSEHSSINFSNFFTSSTVLLVGLIFTIIGTLCVSIFELVKSIMKRGDPNRTRIAYFARIEKYPKDAILHKMGIGTHCFLMFFMFVDGFAALGHGVGIRQIIARRFFNFDNFGIGFFVVLALFIGFLFFRWYVRKQDMLLRQAVGVRRKKQKEENRRQQELARQKNLEKKAAMESIAKQQIAVEEKKEDILSEKQTKENDGQ